MLWLLTFSLALGQAPVSLAATTQGDETPKFTAIAGEYYHFLALDNNGNVWGWGTNISGQLGDERMDYHVAPFRIAGIGHVRLIAAGYAHSTAVTEAGEVWQWGNYRANMPGATAADIQLSHVPKRVEGINNVVGVADSAFYTLVLKKDGTVWGWGRNSKGELGTGHATTFEPNPVQVSQLSNIKALYASFDQSYAVDDKGKLWRWGSVPECNAERGSCVEQVVTVPERFEALDQVSLISEDMAVLQDGTVWKWGLNYQGSLGVGSDVHAYSDKPYKLIDLTDLIEISGTKAVTKEGEVWSWGPNNYGQVGDGTTSSHTKPVLLKGIQDVAAVTSGEEITVALTHDGTLYRWGQNRNGEIANITHNVMPPTRVSTTSPDLHYTLPIPKDGLRWTYLDEHYSPIKDSQIYFKTLPYSEGLAAVQRASDSLWTFIDESGKRPFLKEFQVVREYHEGLAAVKLPTGWTYINKLGKDVGKGGYNAAESFSEGMAAVLQGGKWGYLDQTGKMRIPPAYAEARSFSGGLAAVRINGKWGFIDKSGKVVIPAKYQAAESFSDKAAPVSLNGKWGFISKNGSWFIKPQYEAAKGHGGSGLAPVKTNGKWGYASISGKMVISAQFDDAAMFSEGLAAVRKNGKWAVLGSNGKTVTGYVFTEIKPYSKGAAWVKDGTQQGYLDRNGKWIYKSASQ